MKKSILVIFTVVVIAVVSYSAYEFLLSPDQPPTNSEGIIFKTVEGVELTVDDLLSENQGVLIYFFTTWCPTCEQDLKALNETFQDQEWQVKVLIVGFDPIETLEQIQAYKISRNYTWQFVEYNRDAIIEYEVVTQSTKIAINQEGEVVLKEGFGTLSKIEWQEILQRVSS